VIVAHCYAGLMVVAGLGLLLSSIVTMMADYPLQVGNVLDKAGIGHIPRSTSNLSSTESVE